MAWHGMAAMQAGGEGAVRIFLEWSRRVQATQEQAMSHESSLT